MEESELSRLACSLRVPPLELPEDRPYTASDFSRDRAASATGLRRLAAELRRPSAAAPLEPLAEALLLVAERRRPEPPWSSPEEAAAAAELDAALLAAIGVTSLSELLSAAAGTRPAQVAELVTRRLAEQLPQTGWRRRPATAAGLPWLLALMDGAALSARLAALLPPALLLADDWEPRHQALGARCLRRLLEAVPHAALRRYGRADVVRAALERLCLIHQQEVAVEAYPALLLVLTATEEPDGDEAPLGRTAALHRHVKQLLYSMSTESQPALRLLLLAHLEPVLARLQREAVVWLRLSLEVLTAYVELSTGGDWPLLDGVLRVLSRLVSETRPRLAAHQPALAFLLCRLAHEVVTADGGPPPALRSQLVSVMAACRAAPGCDRLYATLQTAAGQLPPEFGVLLGEAWGEARPGATLMNTV